MQGQPLPPRYFALFRRWFVFGIPGFGSPEIVKDVLPSWKLTHLFENILPQLQQMGVAATDLDHILTENPRRYFEGTEKPAH